MPGLAPFLDSILTVALSVKDDYFQTMHLKKQNSKSINELPTVKMTLFWSILA
jgi:hypothetical protein